VLVRREPTGGDAFDVTNSAVALYDLLARAVRVATTAVGAVPAVADSSPSGTGRARIEFAVPGRAGGDACDWVTANGGNGGDGVRIGAGCVFQQIGCTCSAARVGISNNGHFRRSEWCRLERPGTNFTFAVPSVEMDVARCRARGYVDRAERARAARRSGSDLDRASTADSSRCPAGAASC
jgi:hypothetical protein